MGRFTKLILLAMVSDVFLSALIGAGVYAGFSVYPHAVPAQQADGVSINMTIPLWMPSMQDVKAPFTFLQAASGTNAVWSVIASVFAAIVLSFIRGMYLGGMSGILQNKAVSLWSCGRYYFRRMLGWTVLHALVAGLGIMLSLAFWPLGVILFVLLFFYSLAPYLMVLQDIGLADAVSRSPGVFRRYFTRLLGIALLAALLTLIVSAFNTVSKPYSYFTVMLIYSTAGSALIREFMYRLKRLLVADNTELPQLPMSTVKEAPLRKAAGYLLLPALPLLGIAFASGYHLQALDTGAQDERQGISYWADFSEAFSASQQQYTTYAWGSQLSYVKLSLPDLSKESRDEIRGLGHILWTVDRNVVTRTGPNSTQHSIVQTEVNDTFYYRLKKMRSDDGSYYYSSREGAIGILPTNRKQREPLSMTMTVSGDGRNVFLLQHPTRFDPWQSNRVSSDGSFLIPGTNRVNPTDFRYYWFSNDLQKNDLFRFLQVKNEQNSTASNNRIYMLLAAALQEADGNMVTRLLSLMQSSGVSVYAPSWDGQEWTAQLRGKYEQTDVATLLPFLTKANTYGSFLPELLSTQEETRKYRFQVTFPSDTITIAYTEENNILKQLSVEMSTPSKAE